MSEKTRESMTPQDWLGVGIRLFAVWLLVESLQYVVTYVETRMRLASTPNYRAEPSFEPTSYLVYVVGYAAFVVFLLRGAPRLVAFAYPVRLQDDEHAPVSPPVPADDA